MCMAVSIGLLSLPLSGIAQTAQIPASAAAQAQTHTHPHASRSKKHVKTAPATAPVEPPPPPPLPPVQQAASPAKIDFPHGSLSIDAKNSSLKQILDQISHQTGMEIQGLDHDERIYGQYGPDTVANTLTDLLDGSGYNYVMIGGGDGSPPTRLVLTPGNGGSANNVPTPGAFAPANTSAAGSAAPADTPAAQPPDDSTSAQPKTPQQMFDELRKLHPQPQ